jgi:hypothetical protein
MSPGVQKAVIYTLAVHAVALFILTQITVSDAPSASDQYADVEFFDPSELPIPDESLPSDLQERMNERIANLRADASKESSSESRSTGLTSAEKAKLESEVEAELKAMEEEEFDRLSSEEKEMETVGMPDSKVDSTQIDTMDDWDKQYEGRVTVRFELDGRAPDIWTFQDINVKAEPISLSQLWFLPREKCFPLKFLREPLRARVLLWRL